jgi:hypothetical protein
MHRTIITTTLALACFAAAGSVAAQPADERRGSIPPGTAADGSRPAEGAIKGGVSERPGIEERVERCNTLQGTLREQCLRDAMNPSAGASRPSPSTSEATKPRPPDAPPPQNPR